MEQHMLLDKIADADMCLIGIGEDFDTQNSLLKSDVYKHGCEFLQNADALTFLPAWKDFCIGKLYGNSLHEALEKLANRLKDKNYFVISLPTNEIVASYPWKHERIVSPCGSVVKKQCQNGHGEVVPLTKDEITRINRFFELLYSNGNPAENVIPTLDICPECGEPMVLNNICAENYLEAGYLPKWELYKKWLQGTVNRKLVILELGVGLKYPSVIRWPFEKIAFFNEKAYFFRVHERLSQLTAELSGKGLSISKNPIDWLKDL